MCHRVTLQAKREGQPLPKSIEDMEQSLGDWRQFRTSTAAAPSSSDAAGSPMASAVPLDAVSARGKPCPLAGSQASRNTACPLTKKKYKQCCGKL